MFCQTLDEKNYFFNSAVPSISCVFAEPIDAFGSTVAIRCLQQHSSKLPLRGCLSFQYLSCFTKLLSKKIIFSILQFPQFHVCLQSLLTRLAARWLFDAFNNTLVSCHCVVACHSSICHVLPNSCRKKLFFQFCSFLNFMCVCRAY